MFEQQLGQGDALSTKALRVEVVAQEVDRVRTEDGQAARFKADDESSPMEVFREGSDCGPKASFRDLELASRDPGEPAAQVFGR